VWGSVREWTLTLPKQLPFWEMESRWTPENSENDYRGQNSMACGVFNIIGKLLERRCLKWARIAHLDIWNVSYGQKQGRESNCQFDSRPQKVRNRPDLLSCRGRATYPWKALLEFLSKIAIALHHYPTSFVPYKCNPPIYPFSYYLLHKLLSLA